MHETTVGQKTREGQGADEQADWQNHRGERNNKRDRNQAKKDTLGAKIRQKLARWMLSIFKQEKGCMSVTDFHPYHICRQSRQRKGFSHFCLFRKVYVAKTTLCQSCTSKAGFISFFKKKVYVNSYVSKLGGTI